jgi:hypothetical protein
MKKIMKVVFGGIFAIGLMTTANAQTDSLQNTPSGEDIICLQVEENVFECTLKNGALEEGESLDSAAYEDQGKNLNEDQEVPNFDKGNRDQDMNQEQYKNQPGEMPFKQNPSKEENESDQNGESPTGKEIKTDEGQLDGYSREDILDMSDTAGRNELPEIITI